MWNTIITLFPLKVYMQILEYYYSVTLLLFITLCLYVNINCEHGCERKRNSDLKSHDLLHDSTMPSKWNPKIYTKKFILKKKLTYISKHLETNLTFSNLSNDKYIYTFAFASPMSILTPIEVCDRLHGLPSCTHPFSNKFRSSSPVYDPEY